MDTNFESQTNGLDDTSFVGQPYQETQPKIDGFFSDVEDQSCTVKVAMRIRPMIGKEIREGKGATCITTTPELNKLQIGTKEFYFDRVFDQESNQEDVFDVCAHNLVLGCFLGYNATILAYGQTGSGKTHTMGTGSTIGLSHEQIGIVPRVFDFIFDELDNRRRQSEFSTFELKVQFLELYGEELHDLLDVTSIDKLTGQSTKNIQIREEKNGTISIQGLKGEIVTSKQECLSLLNKGISQRVTSATNMNEGSSRSHAIFTITINQKIIKIAPGEAADSEPVTSEENISAKFHFVDLAGSERIKKTGATGKLMQEGISINKGLLALGNVIAALTDEKKIASGTQFIPYRDSKLTRILQDSLGGNSRTTVVACASPADTNLDESLSTVKYASRARNIKNKPKVNRDANSLLIEALRKQINALQQENSQLQKLITTAGVTIPEGYIKIQEPPKQQQVVVQAAQPQQPSGPSQAQVQEIKDLKLKLARKEKEFKEAQTLNQEMVQKQQAQMKSYDELQQERDELILRQEALSEHLKQNNVSMPKELPSVADKAGSKRKESLADELRAKLSKLQSELTAKMAELTQKTTKIAELQTQIKRDEAVMKKTMLENDKLKRESKRPVVQKQPVADIALPDVEELKSKFMDTLTSQLENIFDDSSQSEAVSDALAQTQNSSLDDKEKLLNQVKQSTDKIKQELGQLLQNTWNSKISEIKDSMRVLENERKVKGDSAEFKTKMDDLNKQLDLQQKEKQKNADSIQKTMLVQESRIKSLENELLKLRKEKEELDNQKKYGEERFHKFKAQVNAQVSNAAKEVQSQKKILTDKDKTVSKLKSDLKKTEQQVNLKIQELKQIQKRALDDKLKREKEEALEMSREGIDIDAIKEWIKLNTEALLNQQELNNYLKEQRKARDDIEEEMLQEGDRLTELMIQKERLEAEREGIEDDEARLLEIEAELDDVALESDSITQTLDTLEEHLNYVQQKVTKLQDEIQAWDPESIKPPRFRGLTSVEMARATLRTFFMVLLDLNVYKKDLEMKCIEQDETILELQGTVTLMQERVGMTASQREVMMQKQKMINQMIGKMGDQVEFMDQRGIADIGLSIQEQNQLTKMSLSKIVGNLRSKLKDEERKNQSMSLKIDQLTKEKDLIKNKMENIKREKKLSDPISLKATSEKRSKPKDLNQDFDFNQKRVDQRQPNQKQASTELPPRRLSFKQRRDMVKESQSDKTALAKTQQNVDSLVSKKPRVQRPTTNQPTSLKDRREAKTRSQDDDTDMSSKLEMLEQDVSSMHSKTGLSEAQKKARKQALLKGKQYVVNDVVEEVDDAEEQSSEDSFAKLENPLEREESESGSSSDDEREDEDIETKLDRAERKLFEQNSMIETMEPSVAATETTNDEKDSDEGSNKWKLSQVIEMVQAEGWSAENTIVDFDSSGDRLFVMFSNMSLVEISIKSGKLVQEIELMQLEGMELQENEAPKILTFSIFKDLNMLAFSTAEAVYLINFENEMKFNFKMDVRNVVFIAYVDIYIVMMMASEEDSSEATLTCCMLYGPEEGSLQIKRFKGQEVLVRAASNSVIFSCGAQIGRVTVPEMELQYQEDTGHQGEIIDLDVSDTCIFTTSVDSSLRLFDIENGMMLIAPMEEMECDHLVRQDDFIVARCGQGQAMLVLKYTDGEEELEEIDFIDLQSDESSSVQQQQQQSAFRMKGGHKVLQDEQEVGVILVADLNAHHLNIRMLKNRSYIT